MLDLYISELQFELEEACGVSVSDWMIRGTLKQQGFVCKKVSHNFTLLDVLELKHTYTGDMLSSGMQ